MYLIPVILPVWHNVDLQVISKYSPLLADRLAVSSRDGIDNVVAALLDAMNLSKSKKGR